MLHDEPPAEIAAAHTKPEENAGREAEGEGPLKVEATYTFDLWSVAVGGLSRGTRYLDNLDLTLELDAERAWGWRAATLFAYALYNNGRPLSDDLIGDIQSTSNIETGVRALRLYELWVEQRFGNNHHSVKVGLYDLNSEFDTTESGSLFLSSSHGVGPDLSQTGSNGPSIFPVTSLAVRGEVRFAGGWRVRAAVLDAVPGDPLRPRRTAVKFGRGDGVMMIGEAEYRDTRTKFALGHWRYTARFEPLDPAAPARRGNTGTYALAERKLTRESGSDDQGLSGWLRFGVADDEINPIRSYFGGGLVYTGALAGRDADRIGAAFALARLGTPARRYSDQPARELAFEFTYRAPLTDWLIIQPDIQYVVSPASVKGIRDALALGLRVELGF